MLKYIHTTVFNVAAVFAALTTCGAAPESSLVRTSSNMPRTPPAYLPSNTAPLAKSTPAVEVASCPGGLVAPKPICTPGQQHLDFISNPRIRELRNQVNSYTPPANNVEAAAPKDESVIVATSTPKKETFTFTLDDEEDDDDNDDEFDDFDEIDF